MRRDNLQIGQLVNFNIYGTLDTGKIVELGPEFVTIKLRYGLHRTKILPYSAL